MQEIMIPDEIAIEERQPFSHAHITLIIAEQGGGKSTLLTARVVDDTFAHTSSVKLLMGRNPDGTPQWYEVPATPALNEKGKPLIGYAIIHLPNREPRLVEVPKNSCVVANKVKVFANYHLYGIRYRFIDLADIVENINTELFLDAWINIDEGYIGADSRNSQTMLNQILGGAFEFQLRKRRIKFQISYPLKKMTELRIRLARTEYIECSSDDKTHEITAEIKKDKEKKKTIHIKEPWIYWPYYKTEERFKLPEGRINRAIKSTW